ncbi:elongin-A [Engraulis encrasicolus]|uniref:elongin-A n=1 Tax=Engraulis encrasicolus TaxID=184585 RepID=UPI002FD01785
MKQFPGPSLPLVNMAEELLETVERLQSRLSENQEPRKLLKTLKRLAELPMTVDILVDTGVGKTVNSLRKHDLVGEAAKSIVAKWKKLVPDKPAERPAAPPPPPVKDVRSHSQAPELHRGHKRAREPSPEDIRHTHRDEEEEEEEEMEDDYRHHHRRHDHDEEDMVDEEMMEEEEEPEPELERVVNRYEPHHGYSPSPPQAYSPTAPGLSGQRLARYQPSRPYDSPSPPHEEEEEEEEEPAAPSPPPPPPPPQKEAHRHSKPHHRDRDRDGDRESARDHSSRDRPKDKERHNAASSGSEQDRRKRPHQSAPTTTSSSIGEGKKSSEREQTGSSSSKREDKKETSNSNREDKHKNTHSQHDRKHTSHDGKKDKKGGRDEKSKVKPETVSFSEPPHEEEKEVFEAPTMSFESFLTYDAPSKKKKKPLKPPQSSSSSSSKPTTTTASPVTHSSSSSSARRSKSPSSSSSHHQKSSATNGASSSSKSSSKSERSSSKRSEAASATPVTPTPEKRRKVVDVMPTLPDIPLPAIQPNYRPLPSIEHTPVSPQRRKVPVSNDEEDAGFTGRRFNSKMVVYSGSKTSYLPKMMSLYEQCIRVLQNNIDSIDEVGGVPFEILEPVLERCTPEQLYRIEDLNQHFLEDTDELWTKHCQRDFKREAPQEYESWRELYLRKHDEREERLRMLTQNISSAHANKPKGRTVKMAYVNSVAKPPRDVRRRQERFGTKSGSSMASASASSSSSTVRIKPAMPYTSHSDEGGHSSSYSGAAESSRASVSGGGLGGGGGGGGGNARAHPEKQVKRIAPMMAKTLKAYKNRFSRR